MFNYKNKKRYSAGYTIPALLFMLFVAMPASANVIAYTEELSLESVFQVLHSLLAVLSLISLAMLWSLYKKIGGVLGVAYRAIMIVIVATIIRNTLKLGSNLNLIESNKADIIGLLILIVAFSALIIGLWRTFKLLEKR